MRRKVVGRAAVVLAVGMAGLGVAGAADGAVAGPIVDLGAREAAQLLRGAEGSKRPIVLDIRTPGEFGAGHIEGAVNVDFRATDFETRIAALDRNATYLVYCRTGNRSGHSMALFERLGFKRVRHLAGGTAEWTREGLPLVP